MTPIAIGIIGCGNISRTYLENLGSKFPAVRVKACADLVEERARKSAEAFPGVQAMTIAELLADREIGVVVNLTIPAVHYAVARQVLEAGKHVYSEKPLAVAREDGRELLAFATSLGLRVGCAPDTFLGGALQTCRKLIDEGAIGTPVACAGFMMSGGPESWHPDPEFFYKRGAGPLFDMGPYYLTAMVSLLGPVKRVTASTRISFAERVIGSEAKRGQKIQVETPTHVAGSLEFGSGAIGTLIMSFDIRGGSGLRHIEIQGSEGTLSVPDPNNFGDPVRIRRIGAKEWEPVTLTHGYQTNWRGLGTADMAVAAQAKRAHRASGEQAFHVLDVMASLLDAGEAGRHVALSSTCARPAPLPVGLADGQLD